MAVRIDALTPVVEAGPGELVISRVRLVNDGPADASVRVRVVGLEADAVYVESGPIAPGASADIDVPFDIPAALGFGRHSVAIEMSSEQPGSVAVLARMTVNVDSIGRLKMAPEPSTVRAGRRGKFVLELSNNEPMPVELELSGGAPGVAVKFKQHRIQIPAGERRRVKGRMRGPLRFSGEAAHHVVTLTATGRSASMTTTAAYIQRGVVPWRLRSALAALTIVLVWLLVLAGSLWWWGQRGDDSAARNEGRSAVDGTLDPLAPPAAGDGAGGGGSGGGGSGGADGDVDEPPPPRPESTVFTGKVAVSGGEPAGVRVVLAPIDLGGRGGGETGPAGRSGPTSKLWSARHAVRAGAIGLVRQTESVLPVVTDGEGVWLFDEVPIRQTYEVVFSKAGYDTQSFVVTPPDDGSRVELDVEMNPAQGAVSGVVIGPNGPLGGAEISVTDGTLTFTTTSVTEATGTARVGEFSLEGLSTPGVYTLTATLRGYGTEVLQLPFSPGQRRTGTTVEMRAGVGSISGRISLGGQPAGGVTVTATSGDIAVSTSSLTDGDTGFFSIPQLAIPADYTVAVSLDGFITQTRRVQLSGNVTSVDFSLVSTRARLTGRVFSSRGEGLVSASITVSVDDASFRTATAATPLPGNFDINDLPPGDYLVRISRYDHLPYSQQVTVAAGQELDIGEITLEFTSRPPVDQQGSLVVRVRDFADNPLDRARVTIERVGGLDGQPFTRSLPSDPTELTDETTFVFRNLPVGTYNLTLTRPIYQTVRQRLTVGLSQRTETFRMVRLGQARGQVVDAASGVPLRGYDFELVRADGPDAGTVADSGRVPANAVPVAGLIEWRSRENSLEPGIYEIRITDGADKQRRGPRGYEVFTDQILDDAIPADVPDRTMRFVVPESSEEEVEVEPIRARPYPLISGRLFQLPATWADATTPVVAFSATEIASWNTLVVRLVCGDRSVEADVAPLDLDGVRPSEGFTLPNRGHHYQFTPFVIQEQQLLGRCSIEAEAPGFITGTATLATDVEIAPDRQPRRDTTVNLAMVRTIGAMNGNVYWRDNRGFEYTIPDVDVTTDPATIIGYDSVESDAGVELVPESVPGSLSARSDAAGRWSIAGHVAGPSTFTFRDTGSLDLVNGVSGSRQFADGTIRVTVNRDGTRTVQAVSNTEVELRADGRYYVRLDSPLPGRLEGSVEIKTIKPEPAFGALKITADGPGGAKILDPTLVPPRTDIDLAVNGKLADIVVAPAPAGFWDVTFVPPPNHTVFGDNPLVVSGQVQPNRTTTGFDTTLVELATVAVNVTYAATTDGPSRGPATATLTSVSPAYSNSVNLDVSLFDRLPVDPLKPAEDSVAYSLTVENSGHDLEHAEVSVNGAPFVIRPSSAIDLNLLAGTDATVAVKLEQYGRLEGAVVGRFWPDDIRPIPYGPGDLTKPLTVAAERVCTTDGEVVPDPPDPRVTVAPRANDGFAVTGPPGYYRITVNHPNYRPAAAVPGGVTAEAACTGVELDDSDEILYLIENATVTPAKTWTLDIERSTLDLSVVATRAFTTPITNATVTLTPQGRPAIVLPASETGKFLVDDLIPGVYRLEIRARTTINGVEVDEAFPVIATLTIPEGPTPQARRVEITAVLPLLRASINGTITAVNSLTPQPGAVRVPAAVLVGRAYTPPPLSVTDGEVVLSTQPNAATDSDVVPSGSGPTRAPVTSLTAVPPITGGLSSTFSFQRVAGGRHVLTLPRAPAGYEFKSASVGGSLIEHTTATDTVSFPVDVDDATYGTNPMASLQIVYQALDVDVEVRLAYPADSAVVAAERSVVLRAAAQGPELAVVGPTRVDGQNGAFEDVYRFNTLPPRESAYLLEIVDPLFTANVSTVLVTPFTSTPPRVQVVPVTMTPAKARITGAVTQRVSVATAQPYPSLECGGAEGACTDVTIELRLGNGAQVRIPYDGSGRYSVDVTTPGEYTVTVSRAGFTTVSRVVTATLGRVSEVNAITLLKQAEVKVTVTNDPATGTRVVVVPVVNNAEGIAVEGQEFTVTPSGTVWTFLVDPDVQYRFHASRPGHYTVTFPAPSDTPNTYTALIGDTKTFGPTTLVPRTVNVSVTGVSSTAETPVPLTVSVTIGSTTSTKVVDAATNGTTAVTFTSLDAAVGDVKPLLLTGTGTVTVSASGFRPNSKPIAESSLANPTQSVSMQMFPVVTSATGTITGLPLDQTTGITVYAFFGSATTATYDTLSSVAEGSVGKFTFSGSGVVFQPGTWTFRGGILGTGGFEKTVTVTAEDPATNAIDLGNVPFAPREVAVTFTITNSPPPTGTKVILGGTSKDLDQATGTVQFRILENVTGEALDYKVTAPGHKTISGAIDAITALTIPVSVTMEQTPKLTGAITGGTNNTTVALRTTCGSTAGEISANLLPLQGAKETYEFPAGTVTPNTTRCVYALKNSGATPVTFTFSVNDDGSLVFTSPRTNLNLVL